MKNLVMLMIYVLVLSACGVNNTPSAAPEPASTSTPRTAAPAARPTEYTASNAPSLLTPDRGTATGIPTSETNSAVFSLSDVNLTTPDDVLQEVDFYATGGGRWICASDVHGLQYYNRRLRFNSELMEPIYIWVCGWVPDETVKITIENPAGAVTRSDVRSQLDDDIDGGGYYVGFTYAPTLDDPTGLYRFTIAGMSGQAMTFVNYVQPAGPRMWQKNPDDKTLLLYGFQPGEKVRLFAYGSIPPNPKEVLVGWKQLQVDKDGRLIVQLGSENWRMYDLEAIGDVSGATYVGMLKQKPLTKPSVLQVSYSCSGAPSVRLQVGMKARVTFSNGVNVRVRRGPGASYNVIKSIPEGTTMMITNFPECHDNYMWWSVRVDDGTSGWVAEGEPGNYFIEPWP